MFRKKKQEVPARLPSPVKDIVESSIKNIEQKTGQVHEEANKKEEELRIKEPEPIRTEIEEKLPKIKKEEAFLQGKEKKEEQKDLFFSKLIEELMSGKIPEEIIGQDLKELMKSYHLEGRITHGAILASRLVELLRQLEEIEEQWKIKNEEKRRIEQELIDLEVEMDEKLEEVRILTEKIRRLQRLKQEVSKEKWFYCVNGEVYRNVFELREALEKMDEATYKYHANNEKNDFAEWIRNVFHDSELADMLIGKDRDEALRILRQL
ncbi:hypothetical protein J7K74_00685 [Candidatus Woesearchaeota archaeon]|nr:hypothetical protein [Candidatus Woesearchaeota archaeon]